MGRRDLRKVTQRKPKTKGKGDELIDWTIKDLDRRGKNLQQQLDLYGRQLLYGMDATPSEVSQPKRKGITKQPSQEERWRKEEEDFAKQQEEWNKANEAQINPIPPDLRTSDEFNPAVQEGVMFDSPWSDQQTVQHQTNLLRAAKLAKVNPEFEFSLNNLISLQRNDIQGESYNRWLSEGTIQKLGGHYAAVSQSDPENVTGVNPINTNPVSAESDSANAENESIYKDSGEQDHYQSEVEAREAEKNREDQSFLTKSNNAAAKSGLFKDEELLALRDRHRSGEWRNKSNVDTKAGTNIGQLFKSNRRESN